MDKNKEIKDKLKSRISNKKSSWLEQAEYYNKHKDWLDKSALIAIKILRHLRANKITQKYLAEKLNVSPQYVNKIVKGKENLSLETICKIEKVLKIKLIDVPQYEKFSELNMTVTSTSVSEQIVSKNKADKVYNQEQDYHSFLEVTTNKKPSLSLVA
jgi:transcriptional regulator with XRE-family HTH domain